MVRSAATPLVLAVLALVACGGEEGPSREGFIAEADALCSGPNDRIAEINRTRIARINRTRDLPALREVLVDVGAITRESLGRLEELEPPADLADRYADYLSTVRRELELLETAGEASSFEEAAGVLQQQAAPVVAHRLEVSRAIGFEECGGRF